VSVLLNRILIRPLQHPKSDNEPNIIRPDSAKLPHDYGEVILAGPGMIMGNGSVRPMLVKVGDKVWYEVMSTQPFEHGGERFLLTRDDCVAIIEAKQ
jgi:co-chaperonin GroES (HSP10)